MAVAKPGRSSGAENAAPAANSPAAANEEGADPLAGLLGRIRADALYARDWHVEHQSDLEAPLVGVVKIISTNNLTLSDDLGAAGFRSDEEQGLVSFNRAVLSRIMAVVDSLFPDEDGYDSDDRADFYLQGARLYIFHELTHITQRFYEHSLAQNLKRAFGPDELSKIDLVADVRAAHCNALVQTAYAETQDKASYLRFYRNSILLAYELLMRAFNVRSEDHKKKRALGLLSGAALTDLALAQPDDDILMSLAVLPVFTSVDAQDGCVVGLSCGEAGWTPLFSAAVQTNRLTVTEMWEGIGQIESSDIVGLLILAYTNGVLRST